METGWVADPGRWAGSASILVCCLSCHRAEPDDLSSPGDPHALIAPFARRNYYGAAVRLMREVAARLEESAGVPRKTIRIFCNSRIPEKPLLVASGIASRGRNSLAIVPGLGSLFVIAGAVIPVPSRGPVPPERPAPPDPCGGCSRCVDACPVGAIVRPGVVDPRVCLQGFAASPSLLPAAVMEKWGVRLYGCQECQAVCPHNSGLTEQAPTTRGDIGPSVSLRRLLPLDAASVRRFFRGTPMGASWVPPEALLRNALIAAGNRRDPVLRDEVEMFVREGSPLLRKTAHWALERMGLSLRGRPPGSIAGRR